MFSTNLLTYLPEHYFFHRPPNNMVALRAVQDEVGCRVCLFGVQSRPELDRLAGTVISVNEARGRIGVQLDDGHRIMIP